MPASTSCLNARALEAMSAALSSVKSQGQRWSVELVGQLSN